MFLYALLIDITFEHLYWLGSGILITLGAVGGIAAAKKNINTEIWTPFKERFLTPRKTRRKKLDEIIVLGEDLKTQVGQIVAEVSPNGGGSIKDAINRIERQNDWTYAKFRHLDETSSTPIFEMDAAANMIFANRALCEMLKVEEADLLDRKWLGKIPNTGERARVRSEWNDATENRSPLDMQHQIAVDTSHLITIHVQATPRVNRLGELRGFFGKIKIISE